MVVALSQSQAAPAPGRYAAATRLARFLNDSLSIDERLLRTSGACPGIVAARLAETPGISRGTRTQFGHNRRWQWIRS